MSTKKLPSRKMRGRIFSWASLWIGSPDLLISIVTVAAPRPPGRPVTRSTLPTSTPAIRTGDFGCRLFAFWKTALSLYGWANGLSPREALKVRTRDARRSRSARP